MVYATACERPAAAPARPLTEREILLDIAGEWHHAKIDYAVANGLQGYPESTGRDIDIVVDPGRLEDASAIVRAVMERCGLWLVVRERKELVQHIGICPAGGAALIVDLFPGLRWGPVWLVGRPSATTCHGPFATDPWVSFVKRVLLHVLVAPRQKFERDPGRLELTTAEAAAAAHALPQLLGFAWAARLQAAISEKDLAALEWLRPHLRRALIVTAVASNPWRAWRTAGQWLRARLDLALCPAAMPTVSIVGPDGVGKSTLIAEVERCARERLRCSRVVVRHWRPGVLPQLGTLAGKPPPRAGTPPRRTAGRLTLPRVLYYGLDFLVGAHFCDRRVARDLGLVLYDRGALDMYVDPLRYGLRPGRGAWLLRRVLPRPDLVILLHDEPARIRARKPELEEAEIRRQLDLWLELVAAGDVDMVLHVDAPPRELAVCVVDSLVERFLARNGLAAARLAPGGNALANSTARAPGRR